MGGVSNVGAMVDLTTKYVQMRLAIIDDKTFGLKIHF